MLMDEKRIKTMTEYWIETAEHDFPLLDILFDNKRYVEALFFGHLVLEKILKAHVVFSTENEAPKIHDLVKLSRDSELTLTDEEVSFLEMLNLFNLEARYPDKKLTAYKIASKEFANENLEKIKIIYHKLCQKLK